MRQSAVVEKYGGLDISVSVIGGGPRVNFLEETEESYLRTVQLTQHTAWNQTQAAARQMKAQGRGGKCIMIGSIMADMTSAKASAYSMAKCALRQLAKTAALELAPEKINVNVIQPGYIDTPGERKQASDDEIENSATCIPLKRMGRGRDIGNLCAFLASAAADYMTGSVIDCDGGFKTALALPGHSQEKGEETAAAANAAKKRRTEE